MTNEQVSLLFKRLLIGLAVFDVIVVVYLLITGRILGEVIGGEAVIALAFFALVIAVLSMLSSMVYAIAKKVYPMLWKSAGFLLLSLITYVLALIITLATVF